ncbi:MAG: rhodanese-like protein [Sphingomonas bacterium]|nr:rhodanese-like protein [Sphingomonas bacterium]
MTVTRRLGIGALALGLAAPFVGNPYRTPRGTLDLDAVVKAINDGSDHVRARQLAIWIRDRRRGLRVIDVRPAVAFADDAIPTAENVPVERLVHVIAAPDDHLVLYSEEGAHAGQAWVMLRALGVDNAVFIPGGLADWRDEVMFPLLPDDMPAAARAEAAALARYFGGSPRQGAAATMTITGAAPPSQSLRRRGC